jgi:plasmid stabilization system protein ParE
VDRIAERIRAFAGDSSAERWKSRVYERAELAAFMPMNSRPVPEFGMAALREVFEGDYRILFLVVPEGIEVATVVHGAMLLTEPEPED